MQSFVKANRAATQRQVSPNSTVSIIAAAMMANCAGLELDHLETAAAGSANGDYAVGVSQKGSAQTNAQAQGSARGGNATGVTSSSVCKSEKDATTSASAVEACRALCVAEDGCSARVTVAICEEYRSCSVQDINPPGFPTCAATSKIYLDCLRAQTDVCNAAACCETQADAVGRACHD